jgi:hypothetical protein
MSAATIGIIVVVAVVVLVIAAMAMTRRRLQQRFGPEYDRVVGEKHSQFRGAAELARRERRVQRLRIRPLTASARAGYAAEWRAVQEGFVDQPQHAVTEGQDLVTSVMKERGYPAEDPDQIAADLSVTHPGALNDYRAAQAISAGAGRGDGSTEDLRQALIHLRAVFGELLGKPDGAEPMESPGAGRWELETGQQVRWSRALEAEVPAGAARVPAAAAPNGAARDRAAPDNAAPDGAARDAAPDDAGTPESEEQLWRPAIRVPPTRTAAEDEPQ